MKLVAIHAIERGRTTKPSRVAPGEIWDATEDEVRDLIPMRAARNATEDESAAFDVEKGVSVAAPVVPSAREALEARAKELDIKFNANLSDEKLGERIAEAEAKTKTAGADDTLV